MSNDSKSLLVIPKFVSPRLLQLHSGESQIVSTKWLYTPLIRVDNLVPSADNNRIHVKIVNSDSSITDSGVRSQYSAAVDSVSSVSKSKELNIISEVENLSTESNKVITVFKDGYPHYYRHCDTKRCIGKSDLNLCDMAFLGGDQYIASGGEVYSSLYSVRELTTKEIYTGESGIDIVDMLNESNHHRKERTSSASSDLFSSNINPPFKTNVYEALDNTLQLMCTENKVLRRRLILRFTSQIQTKSILSNSKLQSKLPENGNSNEYAPLNVKSYENDLPVAVVDDYNPLDIEWQSFLHSLCEVPVHSVVHESASGSLVAASTVLITIWR